MPVITERVKPGSFCRVAAVETYPRMGTGAYVTQITAQCGERGFQIEEEVGANDLGRRHLETVHYPKVALLCLAMCIGCPNQIVAPTK